MEMLPSGLQEHMLPVPHLSLQPTAVQRKIAWWLPLERVESQNVLSVQWPFVCVLWFPYSSDTKNTTYNSNSPWCPHRYCPVATHTNKLLFWSPFWFPVSLVEENEKLTPISCLWRTATLIPRDTGGTHSGTPKAAMMPGPNMSSKGRQVLSPKSPVVVQVKQGKHQNP